MLTLSESQWWWTLPWEDRHVLFYWEGSNWKEIRGRSHSLGRYNYQFLLLLRNQMEWVVWSSSYQLISHASSTNREVSEGRFPTVIKVVRYYPREGGLATPSSISNCVEMSLLCLDWHWMLPFCWDRSSTGKFEKNSMVNVREIIKKCCTISNISFSEWNERFISTWIETVKILLRKNKIEVIKTLIHVIIQRNSASSNYCPWAPESLRRYSPTAPVSRTLLPSTLPVPSEAPEGRRMDGRVPHLRSIWN